MPTESRHRPRLRMTSTRPVRPAPSGPANRRYYFCSTHCAATFERTKRYSSAA